MTTAIDVQGLTFTYRGNSAPTLHDLRFSVDEGEIFGFLGPSGAGKSTTQNVMIGRLTNYAGTVSVAGRDPAKLTSDFYEEIGVAFEYSYFFTRFTALENLTYFRSMYRNATDDPRDLLARFGLEDAADTRVEAFSKGMQTRLGLCRALLNRPRVLFLDEPTSGLDPGTARSVRSIIAEVRAAGTTIFLTTHNMQVADELCDRVAFMVDGRIPIIDRPYHLRRHHGKRTVVVDHRVDTQLRSDEFPLEGLATDRAFHRILAQGRVERLHSQEATLEDVFIATTGRELA